MRSVRWWHVRHTGRNTYRSGHPRVRQIRGSRSQYSVCEVPMRRFGKRAGASFGMPTSFSPVLRGSRMCRHPAHATNSTFGETFRVRL